jgi:phosphonate transport system substrate-binding protein
MYIIKNLLVFIILMIAFSGCNSSLNNMSDTLLIDLSEPVDVSSRISKDVNEPISVAVAAMISPKETFVFYEELFNYIAETTGTKVIQKQRKTYSEVNQMLAKNEVDLAFICSGAYASGNDEHKMEILVIPVSNGKTFYQAYVIAHADSDIDDFSDFLHKKFAFTDPISHSGKFYAEKRMREMGYSSGFFKKTFYSYGHDISIQLVSKQIVDGASVKSSVYDYMEKFQPERLKNIKIIEKSEPFGIPPIVVPMDLDPDKKKMLRKFFLSMHEDPKAKQILDKLLIDKFVLGYDEDYNSIREIVSAYNR